MIARKSFLIVSSTFFSNVVGVFSAIILAKMWGQLSVEALGSIGFSLSIISIFNIFGDLGFTSAHIKKVSEGEDIGKCIGTYLVLRLFMISLGLLFTFIGLYIWQMLFGVIFSDATTYSVFIVMIVYTFIGVIRAIPRDTYIGKKQIAKREIIMVLENLSRLPVLLIVLSAGVMGIIVAPFDWGFFRPLQTYIASHAVGSLAMTYVFGISVSMFAGLWFFRKFRIRMPDKTMIKEYFTFGVPVAFSTFSSIISTNVDKVMIGFFWTSAEVGYYFVVQRVIGFITIFSTAVSTVLFPSISSYHNENNIDKIKEVVHKSERFISMVLVPPVVFIIVFSSQLIETMLDTAYLPAANVLSLMSIWVFVSGLSMPYVNLLIGMNNPKVLAILGVIACGVNIVFNSILVPLYAADGAAIATVISTCVLLVGTRLYSKRLCGIKISQYRSVLHIGAGVVMGAVLFLADYYLIEQMRWFYLIFFSMVGLLIYLALLYVAGEFDKKDFSFYMDILHPKKMFSYVKTELKEE